ncbi:MAG: hypothetical protein HC804_12110 [Anaerolineae bacterium]|nr:hypothetical protein [Anaerolineae bacterium]
MEVMFVVNALAVAGITISVTTAIAIWNRLAKSGRWSNGREAMNDQQFWSEFAKNGESQR